MKKLRIRELLALSKEELAAYVGKSAGQIKVQAWVRSKRVSKNCAFLDLNDGSNLSGLQVVVDEATSAFAALKDIQTGAAIEAKGELKESPAKGQKWELSAHEIVLVGNCDAQDYPLQKKGHTLEFLREIAHLRPRTNTFGAVFRIRNALAFAIHEFFNREGFVWAHTPIITGSDCEGAGEMFTVTTMNLDKLPRDAKGQIDYSQDFFGAQAQLTVSGQLQGEFMAAGLGRIYTFGPTFRAENSNTTRHLAEFWMVEPEIAFCDLAELRQTGEAFIAFVVGKALESCRDDLEFLAKMYKTTSIAALEDLVAAKFATITYTDAVALLQKSGHKFEYEPKWGADLQTEHERYLCEQVFKGPVSVTDYPKDIKAFYMRLNDDGKTVAAMDMLVPGVGELIGGSQREERLDYLVRRMEEMKLPQEELRWYLDLRRFGTFPHAGFGLGFERLVMFVTGMQNIRDSLPSPRFPKHIAF